jgi:endo-1,4-beta-xylanase
LGLKVQITELDMSIFSSADWQLTTKPASEVEYLLSTQATIYKDLFSLFSEKAAQGTLDMVLLWGLSDGTSWLNNSGRTDYPLLFDRTYQPKPAFWSLVNP